MLTSSEKTKAMFQPLNSVFDAPIFLRWRRIMNIPTVKAASKKALGYEFKSTTVERSEMDRHTWSSRWIRQLTKIKRVPSWRC